MKYETITIKDVLNNTSQDHIMTTYEDGSGESFPADPENPRYIQFQEQLAAEQEES